MKFLIDNALSSIIALRLRSAGYDAVHVRDYGMQSAPDDEVFARAGEEGRIIVSADTDFATLLALTGKRMPSVILFRQAATRHPERQAATLLANLPAIAAPLQSGSIIVIDGVRIRVRALPVEDD